MATKLEELIWRFWESLTDDEKLEAANELIRNFGHILPSEYTSSGAAYLKMNFPRVLEKYPQLVMEIRRAMR